MGSDLSHNCKHLLPSVALAAVVSVLLPSAASRAQGVRDLLSVNNEGLQRLDAHFVWMWRYMNLQLATARRACNPTEPQLAKLNDFNSGWLFSFLLEHHSELSGGGNAEAIAIRNVGADGQAIQVLLNGRSVQAYVLDATRLLNAEIGAVLDEQQRNVLQREASDRNKFRAEAVAMVVVNGIERRIYLNEQRRKDLLDAIAEWAEGRELHSPFYIEYPQYIPSIPKSILEAYLETKDVAQLDGLRRINADAVQYEMQMFQHETAIIFDESKSERRNAAGEEE